MLDELIHEVGKVLRARVSHEKAHPPPVRSNSQKEDGAAAGSRLLTPIDVTQCVRLYLQNNLDHTVDREIERSRTAGTEFEFSALASPQLLRLVEPAIAVYREQLELCVDGALGNSSLLDQFQRSAAEALAENQNVYMQLRHALWDKIRRGKRMIPQKNPTPQGFEPFRPAPSLFL